MSELPPITSELLLISFKLLPISSKLPPISSKLLPIMLRSKGLKGATCTGLLVWRMSVANWKLLVLSVHKGLTPLVPGMCDRWYGVRPRLVYRARGEWRASKGALKRLRGKGKLFTRVLWKLQVLD